MMYVLCIDILTDGPNACTARHEAVTDQGSTRVARWLKLLIPRTPLVIVFFFLWLESLLYDNFSAAPFSNAETKILHCMHDTEFCV